MAGKRIMDEANKLADSVEKIAEAFQVRMDSLPSTDPAAPRKSSMRINLEPIQTSFLRAIGDARNPAAFSKACEAYKLALHKEFLLVDPTKKVSELTDFIPKINREIDQVNSPEKIKRLFEADQSAKHNQDLQRANNEEAIQKARWGHYAKWMGDRINIRDEKGKSLKGRGEDEFVLPASGTYNFDRPDGSQGSMTINGNNISFDNSISAHNNRISGLPFQGEDFVLVGALMTLWGHYKIPNQLSDYNMLLSMVTMAGNAPGTTMILSGVKPPPPSDHAMRFARLVADFDMEIDADSLAKFKPSQQKELKEIRELRAKETALASKIEAMRDRLMQKDTADVAITATNSGLLPNDVARYKELCAEITKLHKEHYNWVNMHPGHTDCFGGYGRYKEMADQLATISKALPPENQKNTELLLNPINKLLKNMDAQLEHLTPNRKAGKAKGNDIERDVDSPLLPKDQKDQKKLPLQDQANIPLTPGSTSIPLKR